MSHRDNLTLEGKQALKTLLAANKRLNTAYLLKEAFGQLWSYERKGWARRFFENWQASLKWQRLKPYEKFAEMIERHGGGIAAYCKPENKVSLGCVEGLNNTIRVIQRKAYGFRDEQYLAMKIITLLPPLPKSRKNHPHVSELTLKKHRLLAIPTALRGAVFPKSKRANIEIKPLARILPLLFSFWRRYGFLTAQTG